MSEVHVDKRETPLGRWAPVMFYAVNWLLWLITGLGADACGLLWLAVLPLPALGLYLWHTRKSVA